MLLEIKIPDISKLSLDRPIKIEGYMSYFN